MHGNLPSRPSISKTAGFYWEQACDCLPHTHPNTHHDHGLSVNGPHWTEHPHHMLSHTACFVQHETQSPWQSKLDPPPIRGVLLVPSRWASMMAVDPRQNWRALAGKHEAARAAGGIGCLITGSPPMNLLIRPCLLFGQHTRGFASMSYLKP